MFLYEVGDESALEALKAAEDDPEFEVSLQVKMAIERIEHGEEAKGSVWKQMTESRKRTVITKGAPCTFLFEFTFIKII